MLRYETLVTGAFVENGYIVWDDARDDAVVIDPGAEPERWTAWFDDNDLQPVAVLGTHAHLDHVGAVAALQETYDTPYLLHADEVEMLEHLDLQCDLFGIPRMDKPRVTGHVVDGQEVSPGGVEILPIANPGHTPGGTSYHVPGLDRVFTGDTLFAGSIGRTDLPGGDTETLLASLKALVQRLGDDTVVCPGHGPETTIGVERRTNPFFRVER